MKRLPGALILGLGLTAAGLAAYAAGADKGEKKVDTRVFEMRIYYANPGKMNALHARFRDHTCKLFCYIAVCMEKG